MSTFIRATIERTSHANLSEIVTVDFLSGFGVCQCPLAAGADELALSEGRFQHANVLSYVVDVLPVRVLVAQRVQCEGVDLSRVLWKVVEQFVDCSLELMTRHRHVGEVHVLGQLIDDEVRTLVHVEAGQQRTAFERAAAQQFDRRVGKERSVDDRQERELERTSSDELFVRKSLRSEPAQTVGDQCHVVGLLTAEDRRQLQRPALRLVLRVADTHPSRATENVSMH